MQAKLAIVGLASLAMVATVDARPSVTVVGDAPFTERDLGDAVELRIGDDVEVRITRDADGRLVVDVEGRRQAIVLDARDPQAAARIVAMVVVALIEDKVAVIDGPAEAEVPRGARETPPPQRPSRFVARVVPIGHRDDSGSNNVLITASVGYHLSTHARIVASLGAGPMSDNIRRTYTFPLRLGFEATAAGVGIEVGGLAIPYLSQCGGGKPAGLYAAARKYIPFSDKGRALLEAGAYKVLANNAMCFEPPGYQSHAGWLGVGVEWSF